jgi:hypothetical protein|tara:strand:- start:876 stop:1064 length:189 start_codon:yes stop_codon:yes gene_type:complete
MEICSETKYLRHDICTLNDFSLISKFRELMKNTHLISSEWDTYGREKKINNLFSILKEKKIM